MTDFEGEFACLVSVGFSCRILSANFELIKHLFQSGREVWWGKGEVGKRDGNREMHFSLAWVTTVCSYLHPMAPRSSYYSVKCGMGSFIKPLAVNFLRTDTLQAHAASLSYQTCSKDTTNFLC